jgi:hypothetical protein
VVVIGVPFLGVCGDVETVEVARPDTSVSAESRCSVEKVSHSSPASAQKSNSPLGHSRDPSTVDVVTYGSVPLATSPA